MVEKALVDFVEGEILPLYAVHDRGHDISHAQAVITGSLELCAQYKGSPPMAYVIAAYHDVGLRYGRADHHLTSAAFLRADSRLHSFFTPEEIAIMAEAVEDHRASGGEPRSLYGKIVSEADRLIDPETVLFRCIAYSKAQHPGLSRQALYERVRAHVQGKYGEGGYLKLWLKGTRNQKGLHAIRALLKDPIAFEQSCQKYFEEENSHENL